MALCLEIREAPIEPFNKVIKAALKALRSQVTVHPTFLTKTITINLTEGSKYAKLRKLITALPISSLQSPKLTQEPINLSYFELIEVMDHFFTCDENAEDFLPLLQVLAENDPLGFVCLFSDPSRLSSKEALPLMTLLAKEVPKEFAERYHNFPRLSFEEALPLLKIIAEKAPYSFLNNLL